MVGFLRLTLRMGKTNERSKTRQDSTPCSTVRHFSRVPALSESPNPFATQLSRKDSVVSHSFTPTQTTPARLPFNVVTSHLDTWILAYLYINSRLQEREQRRMVCTEGGRRNEDQVTLFLSSALIRLYLFFPRLVHGINYVRGQEQYLLCKASLFLRSAGYASPAKALQKKQHIGRSDKTKNRPPVFRLAE